MDGHIRRDRGLSAEAEAVVDALDRLFRHSSVGFGLLDPELRYLVVNPVLAEVNGLPVAEHLDRYVLDLLPGVDPGVASTLEEVLRTGEPLHEVEVSGTVPASPLRRTWLEDLSRVETPSGEVVGVATVVTDVTAERRATRRLRQVLDALFSFVGLCDPDGTLVEANREAVRTGGLDLDDVLGHPVWDTPWFTWDGAVTDQVRESVRVAAAGGAFRTDLEVSMAHGHLVIDYQMVPVLEDGVVVALVPSATDVTARRRSADQTAALAALSRRLSGSAAVEDLVRAVHDDAPGSVGCRSVVVTWSPGAAGTAAAAVRTGTTTTRATGGDHPGTEVACPLTDGDGRAFGALTFAFEAPTDLDDELRSRMETLTELCAQSIERARLSESHAVAARRTAALARLAAELAPASTLAAVEQAIGRHAPPVVGAVAATLGLVDAETRLLSVDHQPVDRGGDGPPHATAVRTHRPVFLTHPQTSEGDRAGSPGRPARSTGAECAVPLTDGRDRVSGALGFTWAGPVQFDAELRATIATVAELCGQTLERARLQQAEHEFVDALQRRFLRPLPLVPGVDLDATYRAARASVGIGGDFYEALALADGRLAVLLGDVAGHGMAAAADMAQLRTVLSTLLAAGVPVVDLFPRADPLLEQVAGTSLATAVAAVVDPVADTLTYVHAGHPPLVVRTPGGRARTLDDGRGALLGLELAQAEAGVVPFPRGSVLVGYTDGLVETRTAGLDDGIARVVEALDAAAPDETSATTAARLLDRCVGQRLLEDDVAMLVVRRLP